MFSKVLIYPSTFLTPTCLDVLSSPKSQIPDPKIVAYNHVQSMSIPDPITPKSHHQTPHVGKKLNYETQPQENSLKRRGRLGRTLAMELVDMTRFCSIHLWALHGCMGGGGMWIAERWLGLFTFAPFLRTAWGNPPI